MSAIPRMDSASVPHQNGWAAAAEFSELHGGKGRQVAFKAQLLDDPKKRELLFFLHALYLRHSGWSHMAHDLAEMFPERIGTPTMLKIGCQPGKHLTAPQHRAIQDELFGQSPRWDDLLDGDAPEPLENPAPWSAAAFCDECLEQLKNCGDFLERLCCDPRLQVAARAEADGAYPGNVRRVLDRARRALDENPKLAHEHAHLNHTLEDASGFQFAEVCFFDDILGALFEYQRRHVAQARADYVETSVGKTVFEALDYMLETGRPVLIEGASGLGKTTALKAWADQHLGQVRLIELIGIMSPTRFWHILAEGCGVAHKAGPSKVQMDVEDFLKRTKLALILDEGQYLWPQGKRVEANPKLINWLNTACYNRGVPFAISATSEFTRRRQAVERDTEWSSEQARRRTRKVFKLPELPMPGQKLEDATLARMKPALEQIKADLRRVARKRLGELAANAVEMVVGYALSSRGYFQTVNDVLEDAQLIAKRAGRDRITFKDLKAATYEWRAPSDGALQRVFDSKPVGRRGQRIEPTETPLEPDVDEPSIPVSETVNPRLRGGSGGVRDVRPALVTAGDG